SFFLRGTPLSGLARFHTPRGPGSPPVPGSTCTRRGSGVAGDRECCTPTGRADLDRVRIERARPRKGKPMAARTRGHKVKRGMWVTVLKCPAQPFGQGLFSGLLLPQLRTSFAASPKTAIMCQKRTLLTCLRWPPAWWGHDVFPPLSAHSAQQIR